VKITAALAEPRIVRHSFIFLSTVHHNTFANTALAHPVSLGTSANECLLRIATVFSEPLSSPVICLRCRERASLEAQGDFEPGRRNLFNPERVLSGLVRECLLHHAFLANLVALGLVCSACRLNVDGHSREFSRKSERHAVAVGDCRAQVATNVGTFIG
jgi:hypothetical protein